MSGKPFKALAIAVTLAFSLGFSDRQSPWATLPKPQWGNPTCAVPAAERSEKERLLQEGMSDPDAARQYAQLVESHAKTLNSCRDRTWPSRQAVWLRLYADDTRPGVLEGVLDRIVNRGYNQVYVEVFYDGRVLLPVNHNPTPWRSVLAEAVQQGEASADADLWADAIRKGRARGLNVYGWMFSLNFGYGYSEVPGSDAVVARNGLGETSIAHATFDPKAASNGRAFYIDATESENLFVDPYSDRARSQLLTAVNAFVRRQPDGMLFDYIRYPTTPGENSLVKQPRQLWIYSQSSQQALMQRLDTPWEKALMKRYLQTGTLTSADTDAVKRKFAQAPAGLTQDAASYRDRLWKVATNHAYAGVLEFADAIAQPARQRQIPVATVFFPGGNRAEGGGFDARMQPWDHFSPQFERHPMSYAICPDASCVAEEVQEVVQQSPRSQVCPILAGTWGQDFNGHASLETQMAQIQENVPQLSCVSHFVYAWMEPDSDRIRKAGKSVDSR